MMHHPNMHHQAMSGHPPQHMPGHQGMPGHHQMPPHQMHRDNRVPLGPSGGAHGHGHGQMGLGAVPVHPAAQRPPHPARPMHHAPAPGQHQHHQVPPHTMKQMRRPYGMGGGFGPGGGPILPPPYHPRQPQQHQPHSQPQPTPHPQPHPQPQPQPHTGMQRPISPILLAQKRLMSDFVVQTPSPAAAATPGGDEGKTVAPASSTGAGTTTGTGTVTGIGAATGGDTANAEGAAPGDSEAARPAPAQANSKEKTPMCLVNELARYNKIKHQYRLTSETGPAHKKVFTVTLRLGDTEEYTAEGSSIKRAQHAAAQAALCATSFPPPPPRAAQPHSMPHSHHRHSVMPTVELNALAMKLCQPAVYTSIPAVACRGRGRPYRLGVGVGIGMGMGMPMGGMGVGVGGLTYRVRVAVGGRGWLGEGSTPQAARHDAAARALHDLRPPPAAAGPGAALAGPGASPGGASSPATSSPTDADNGDANGDMLNSEVKSPVSLVHELALKRNLSVQFTVKSERGPPHMRVFVTACTVGEIETEGEGNGKKISKRRAAEQMLEEVRRRWPPALLRARPPHDKRRHQPAKKKPRNLIKEGSASAGVNGAGGGAGGGGGGAGSGAGLGGGDNPISRLAVARHAARARSPQYRVLEERGQARRREFLVQCDAPPHSATGLGPNKKTAKRRAAHNVLLAMEMGNSSVGDAAPAAVNGADPAAAGDATKMTNGDVKRKDGDSANAGGAASVGVGANAVNSGGAAGGGANSDIRQPVPGVLMMDYHQRAGQPTHQNGVSETSATGGVGGNTPGAKDQLMYLSQLLGFTVQFSDFPKRNHGEYLSLVSLSTEPPVMCHGGGPSTAHSHEQCSRAALRALAMMGLDAPQPLASARGATE